MCGSVYSTFVIRESHKEHLTICRPGIGGSTAVPVDKRIKVWLETVPAVLQILWIEHVSLVSHSAGTIYCLNTLSRLRDVLHPKSPYVAITGEYPNCLISDFLTSSSTLGTHGALFGRMAECGFEATTRRIFILDRSRQVCRSEGRFNDSLVGRSHLFSE